MNYYYVLEVLYNLNQTLRLEGVISTKNTLSNMEEINEAKVYIINKCKKPHLYKPKEFITLSKL